ncbi:altronate dehydratase family protein [Compostibacter hankyongensis]|uniref:Altronate dehydratase family protein n=1 Tax=Compostibacter hankyongensis TaxID=1007089 RepID=A0ABP8FRP4_9BACT
MKRVLQIHPRDNVRVALADLRAGTEFALDGQSVRLAADIPQKHKFTVRALAPGEDVYMYGVLVGKTVEAISAGGLLTVHNVQHAAQHYGRRTKTYHWQPPDISRWKDRTFMGYHRSDGQVGTQNYWLVIPLVFCENRNIQIIRDAFLKELGYAQPDIYRMQVREMAAAWQDAHDPEAIRKMTFADNRASYGRNRLFPGVDGIKFLVHEGGCGGTREDANNLCGLLAGYSVHPNVAGITVLSLGCQHAQFDILKAQIAKRSPHFDKPLLFFEQQAWGSEFAMISEAIRQTFLGLAVINEQQRKPAPLSKLTVGVKCGGSDGFSGISANPAVGHCADLLVALGARVVMAEFPELCGVEQELIDRCVNDDIAARFSRLMTAYAHRAEAVGSGFDKNPSPGNIRDGLITDAIKSAGAARKGGTSPVTDVLDYPEYAVRPGLNLLCTPGNDVEATTGMGGAGCTLQLFTTGLGTPTGNPVSPMVKIATNHALARRMPDIIDIDTGGIISGEQTVEEAGIAILEYLIGVAGGEHITRAMALGQDDFIPWKRGVSL